MKPLLLLLFCLLLSLFSDAQSLSWFHGDWMGETYFANGPITKRIIVKLRVIKITGNRFEALLDNLYPNDTTVRLERKIGGEIINGKLSIESSEQVYIRDPRTQNFWRDCTGCDIQSGFSISSNQVVIQLKTTNCNDECNGETTFSRDTSELDSIQHSDLAKWFHLPALAPLAKNSKATLHNNTALTAKDTVAIVKKDSMKEQETTVKTVLSNNKNTGAKNIDMTAAAAQASVSTSSGKQDTVATYAPSGIAKQLSTKLQPDSAGLSVKSKQTKPASERIKPMVKQDSLAAISRQSASPVKDSLIQPGVLKKDTIPEALTTRITNLVNTYQVSSPHIIIQLFDNAEIDGDIVTVYHNGQLMANRQSLTHKAITLTIDASKANAHHEFIMVADNLGLIPPNTALMRITAGSQKFELEVSSDFDNNSKIAIDYTGE